MCDVCVCARSRLGSSGFVRVDASAHTRVVWVLDMHICVACRNLQFVLCDNCLFLAFAGVLGDGVPGAGGYDAVFAIVLG
jgi:hypothetical protein